MNVDRPGLQMGGEIKSSSPLAVLTGPSGSGKTTLFRSVAGLEPSLSAELSVEGQVWQRPGVFLPTEQRTCAWMPQSSLLFPHLTVEQNLGFARTGIPMHPVAEALEVSSLLSRRPFELSGGEQQRVALGRAVLSGRSWLLLDEPFSAQDRERRERMLAFLQDWLRPGRRLWLITHRMEDLAGLSLEHWRLSRGRLEIVNSFTN